MPSVQIKDYCFAYQPILGPDKNTLAMELLYRDPQPEAMHAFDHTTATANVIINVCSHIGMLELIGQRKLFINVAEDLLLDDAITLLPKDKVTLELLEHIEATDEIVARVRQLKEMGYEFALDDYVYSDTSSPLLALVDIIKVDILHADLAALDRLVASLRQWPCKLLAEKVEDQATFEACLAAGFDLFQGYFFAHPALLGGKLTDPNKLVVLNLLSKVNTDADIEEIETVFKGNPGLTYSLLRLISSPAFYVSQKIDSIRQALQMLGMRQLGRWLQVLLFTQHNAQHCLPLLEMAVHRARLLELAAQPIGVSPERAYVTGMFSLADSALGIEMQEILAHLNLVDQVEHALLRREGALGKLLKLCENLENGEFDEVATLAAELGIAIPALMEFQKQSIEWGNRMLHDLFTDENQP